MGVDKIGNKAIFLDRDGIINEVIVKNNKPYSPGNLSELVIKKLAYDISFFAKKKSLYLICITNQPDVARGKSRLEDISHINNVIVDKLKLDALYCCYHDSIDNCNCRKPKIKFFKDAKKKFNIDLSKSIMIGDREKDIEAGTNAGTLTIFYDYNYDEVKPSNPNYVVKDDIALLKLIQRLYKDE